MQRISYIFYVTIVEDYIGVGQQQWKIMLLELMIKLSHVVKFTNISNDDDDDDDNDTFKKQNFNSSKGKIDN